MYIKKTISRESDNNGRKKSSKPIGPQINYLDEINKELSGYDQETKIAIQLFIDGVASRNKTNEITQGRYLSLLCELRAVSTTSSTEAFKAAVRKAATKKTYSVNYIKAIIAAGGKNNAKITQQSKPKSPQIGYEYSPIGERSWYRVEGNTRAKINESEVPPGILERHRGAPPPEGESPL